MNRFVRSFAAAVSLAAALAARADASLVLTDGQVIKGKEITRQGDNYLVTMSGGNAVPFPAALVREVRISDDADVPPPLPPGREYAEPKPITGPLYPSQDPSDQLKVFGPPTKWQQDAVDTSWTPTNAYDTTKDVMAGSRSTWSKSAVDTTWTPTNAYDTTKDVMAGSRSTWSSDAVDTTWKPQDGWGFKPLSFRGATRAPEFVDVYVPPPVEVAAGPPPPDPWKCGETLFASDSGVAGTMRVRPLEGPAYAALGVPLYVAETKVASKPRTAVFTIAGGTCRLVGGDADAVLGLNLTADVAMLQDTASFNAAMASRGGARVPAGVDKLDYALALVALIDPRSSGSLGAATTLITKPDELYAVTSKAASACTLTKGKRRKEARAATAAVKPPRITAGKEGDVVTFLTWSGAGGTLYRNTVVLSRDGVVSVNRDTLASHLGAHTD